MSRLIRDSRDDSQHNNIKRWERTAQRAAWKRRGGEEIAAPMPCPWRDSETDPIIFHPAHLLALFDGDLALVRFAARRNDAGGVRIVRGGIPWEQWFPVLLKAYLLGVPVPAPFLPVKRLPPDWVEKALEWKPAEQRAFFDRLRAAKLLPSLQKISAENVSPWLRWEDVRARFIDFR